MKKYAFLSVIFILLLTFSCSTTDDDGGDTTDDTSGTTDDTGETGEIFSDYFPLDLGTYWTYDNVGQETTRDSLFVTETVIIDSETFTSFNAEIPATAFMTSLFSNSDARTTETEFMITGSISGPEVEGFPEIDIPIENFLLYVIDALEGSELSSFSGTISQVIMDIPIDIDYVVSSSQGASLDSYIAGTETFDDVISSFITINLAITAQVEVFPDVFIPVPILSSQDVLVATNYYAAGVGLVYSEVLVEYELQDLSDFGIELPFPSSASNTSTQTIDTYLIGL